MNISAWDTNRVTTKPLKLDAVIVVMVIITISQGILINSANAETGKGTDIFKVIMTIFGVE